MNWKWIAAAVAAVVAVALIVWFVLDRPNTPTGLNAPLIGVANKGIYYWNSNIWSPVAASSKLVFQNLAYDSSTGELWGMVQSKEKRITDSRVYKLVGGAWADQQSGSRPGTTQDMLSMAAYKGQLYGIDAKKAKDRAVWQFKDSVWTPAKDLLGRDLVEIFFIGDALWANTAAGDLVQVGEDSDTTIGPARGSMASDGKQILVSASDGIYSYDQSAKTYKQLAKTSIQVASLQIVSSSVLDALKKT